MDANADAAVSLGAITSLEAVADLSLQALTCARVNGESVWDSLTTLTLLLGVSEIYVDLRDAGDPITVC